MVNTACRVTGAPRRVRVAVALHLLDDGLARRGLAASVGSAGVVGATFASRRARRATPRAPAAPGAPPPRRGPASSSSASLQRLELRAQVGQPGAIPPRAGPRALQIGDAILELAELGRRRTRERAGGEQRGERRRRDARASITSLRACDPPSSRRTAPRRGSCCCPRRSLSRRRFVPSRRSRRCPTRPRRVELKRACGESGAQVGASSLRGCVDQRQVRAALGIDQPDVELAADARLVGDPQPVGRPGGLVL